MNDYIDQYRLYMKDSDTRRRRDAYGYKLILHTDKLSCHAHATLHNFDEIGREDAFSTLELASPPCVHVVALLGDRDNLAFLEGQIAGLEAKSCQRSSTSKRTDVVRRLSCTSQER